MAGAGHSDTQLLMRKPAGELYTNVSELATWVINYNQTSINRLLSRPDLSPSQKDERLQTLLKDWIATTSAFSYPIASYATFDEFKNSPYNPHLPLSARTILWETLYASLEVNPANDTLKRLIARLVEEDLTPFANPEAISLTDRLKRLNEGSEFLLFDGNTSLKPYLDRRVSVFISEGIPLVS